MSDPVRMGVVGTGSVALRGLLPHLTCEDNDERVRVTAVCDIDADRARAAAEEFDVPAAFAEYDQLLASETVDAISLATPIGIHFEQGMQAIEHGIHVHVNKTFCTTLDEATALIDAARAAGVKVVASPGQLTRPREQRVRKLIDDGGIGTPTWAAAGRAFGSYHLEEHSVRGGDDPLSNVDPSWYFRKPGGGPMYDMTVYELHSLTGMLGPADRVTAMSGISLPEREFHGEPIETEMDDNTFLLLDFGEAMTAFVYGAAFGGLPGVNGFLINGSEGQINGNRLNGDPIDGADEGSDALPHVTGEHRSIPEAHVYEDVMQLVDWVRAEELPIATVEHARHVVEIIEQGYRSAETGTTQELTTDFEVDTSRLAHY